MARLGRAVRRAGETFSGLAGMGDLIVTCFSRYSRNRRAGELIAQGGLEQAKEEIGMVVEGLTTAPSSATSRGGSASSSPSPRRSARS